MATNWVRTDRVVWEELNGDALLVDAASGRSWTLNATAVRIWKHCDGRLGLHGLASKLSNVSQRQIENFCEQFAALGLLQPSPEHTLVPATSSNGSSIVLRSTDFTPPMFRELGLGSGTRRRPSPRGNSGPG